MTQRYNRGTLLCLALLETAVACKSKVAEETPVNGEAAREVLLRGSFQSVGGTASGTAEIVRQGDDYTLELTRVTVTSKNPVHVYLVGLPQARSTAAVDGVEMKYDMAVLDPKLVEQRIELPSEPDAALRSVVLWDPAFGANLASAALSPVH